MTADTVLIAALSGRGLAASARRAGYLPLVADAFGDSDTAELAARSCRVADAARIGFRAKTVFAALAELEAAAPSPPIGLILGWLLLQLAGSGIRSLVAAQKHALEL